MTTGMSYGAGCAQIAGMALTKDGFDTKMISMAGARMGDDDYAAFSTSVWKDQYRMTNDKDLAV